MTCQTSKQVLEDPRTGNSIGELRAFDVVPQSGDLFTKVFMYDFNQKRLNLSVDCKSTSNQDERFSTEIAFWIYDDAQEHSAVFTKVTGETIISNFPEIMREISGLVGETVVPKKMSATKNLDVDHQRYYTE